VNRHTRQRSREARGQRDNPLARVQPTAIYAYTDRVHAWLENCLLPWELKAIRQNCDHLYYDVRGKCPFSSLYRCHIQVIRPSKKAIAILKHRPGRYWINYLEEGLDLIFYSKDDREDATDTVNKHHVKKYRRRSKVKRKKQSRYTNRRRARSNFVTYDDKACRQTGEMFCLHIDWRLKRPGLVQAILTTWEDITNLNRTDFWKQRLVFKTVDYEKLGGLFNKNKDRKANIRLGKTIMTQAKEVQVLIDNHGKDVDIRRCLIDLEVGHLIGLIEVVDNDGGWKGMFVGDQRVPLKNVQPWDIYHTGT
jgi:hypothetical protein